MMKRSAGLLLILIQTFSGIYLRADEYTLRGTVTSVLYDLDGNPIKSEVVPGIPPTTICDFIWYRKDEKWRLEIRQPDPLFPEGLWKSIMPFTESELISIKSTPGKPGNPNSGNAFVMVLTNKLLHAESVFGAHAVWFTFNLDQVMAKFGPLNQCPPFWDYDPSINRLQSKAYRMIPTNGAVIFWNAGYYVAKDENQKVEFEQGEPRLLLCPFPLDKGFMEAEYRPSIDLLDAGRRIPKQAEFIYWGYVKDLREKDGARMTILSKLIIETQSIDLKSISASIFSPAWTNAVAVVVDERERGIGNQSLSYVTKEKSISPSKDELRGKKQFSDRMIKGAKPSQQSSSHFPALLLLVALLILPAIGWRYFRSGST